MFSALSLDDERRQIGNLVIGFLMKVRPLTSWSVQLSVKTSPQISFGRDFEQQLGFFVEARASFSNVDSILVFLIQVCRRLCLCVSYYTVCMLHHFTCTHRK